MWGRDLTRGGARGPFHVAYGIVAAVATLVYFNALQTAFVYDDHRLVVENFSIRDFRDWRAVLFFQPGRPLLNISYAIDYAIWGDTPFGFHLTNVLLHILNTMMLLRVGVAFATDRPSADAGSYRPETVGLAAALLFAVHPLMTSAVTYVTGRSEVLCATFFLPGLLCARRGLLEQRRRWWAMTAVLWLLALATKEVAVMFPFVLMCYERFVLRLKGEGRTRAIRVLIGPLLGIAAVAAIARLVAFSMVEHQDGSLFDIRFLIVELNVVVSYLKLMLLPEGQTIFHAVPMYGLFDPRTLVSAAVIAAMLVIAWRVRQHNGLVTFGLLWFFLLLVPTTLLVMLGRAEPMAEHRVYLAGCGLMLAAGTVVEWLLRPSTLKQPRTRLVLRVLMAVALVSLGGRAILRNAIWADPIGLWREAVDRAPNHWLPRLLLGEALHAAGRREEAIVEYRRGIDLQPDQELAYQKLARAWLETGQVGRAWATFYELRDRRPNSPTAANGLGALALLTGDREGALAHFHKALALDRLNVTALQSLALIAETEPIDAREALRLCEEIKRLAPRTPGNAACIHRNKERLAQSGAVGR
jgi:hypothetical protein